MEREIGTVISTFEGPSPDGFSFVIDKAQKVPVRKDEFVCAEFEDGSVVARVESIRKTNRYFARAETVREYGKETEISSLFPIDSWEFLVADAKILGVFSSEGEKVIRSTFPISPGSLVRGIAPERLAKFFGFDPAGMQIGKVEHHDVACSINPTRLLQKHLAILAMSGAGKSHLTRVLIEELLDRKKETGRLGVVVMDIHGEYSSFADPGLYQARTILVDCSELRIAVPDLTAREICTFSPAISAIQRRALDVAIRRLRERMRESGNTYDLQDIVEAIRSDEELEKKKGVRDTLCGWLEDLASSRLFAAQAFPSISQSVLPGTATVFDLSKLTSSHHKQMIVSHVSKKLFELRKRGGICPYVEIIEEAHNFVPQGESRENAVARGILETVAREGRKFCASLILISQRPVRLSTTILSQCNTHVILRVTNPNDLEHISQSSEGITGETLGSITSLRVGEALIVGEAVNYPLFIKIRDRRSPPPRHSQTIEEVARQFEAESSKRQQDAAEAFV